MLSLDALGKWKVGLSLLLTIALAIWLKPLPIGAIVIIFLALFAAIHLIAAGATAIAGARQHKEN